jgi:low temperature requirement protein LtrA
MLALTALQADSDRDPDQAPDMGRLSRTGEADEVKRASPLELFFDLVFVFALTQVTVLMADAGDWGGIGQGMLVLAAIWWAWAAYAWLTNEVDPDESPVRIAVFAAMIAMLIAALALPGAFENEALLFACAYLAVRVLHVAVFAAGTSDVGVRAAVRQLAPPAVTVPAFLIAAAFLDGWAQAVVWILVIAGDFVTGGVRGIEGFRLSPAHFAERHGLIVIIALGESIVAIGVGLAGVDLSAADLATAGLGVCVAAAMWWIYFDRAAEAGELAIEAAAPGRQANTLARDSYSYLHLGMAAGIVLLALGVKSALAHVDDPLDDYAAFAACGGVAIYLLAQLAFRRRTGQPASSALVAGAAAAALLFPAAVEIDAIWSVAALAAIAAAVVVADGRRRPPQEARSTIVEKPTL